jgi:hypothetical protein
VQAALADYDVFLSFGGLVAQVWRPPVGIPAFMKHFEWFAATILAGNPSGKSGSRRFWMSSFAKILEISSLLRDGKLGGANHSRPWRT